MVKLVGIVNVTPDSFSDGGQYLDPRRAVGLARQMFADGAWWVDIGAESTRPGAKKLTPKEEWQRLEPVLATLIPQYPGKISLDSYHPETIRSAFKIGPVIVNDVTGLNNPQMIKTVISLRPSKVIISHLPGANIQLAHSTTPVESIKEVKESLLDKAKILESMGFSKKQIVLDPGIGFGKEMSLNRELLKFGDEVPDYDVMIGYSRKRFLGDNRMDIEPNLTAGRIAIKHRATYLRVHDIKNHLRSLEL